MLVIFVKHLSCVVEDTVVKCGQRDHNSVRGKHGEGLWWPAEVIVGNPHVNTQKQKVKGSR